MGPIETDQESGLENFRSIGRGRFTNGYWYCECGIRARCRTTQKLNHNHGKKFWTCSKEEVERCGFFLWVESGEAAKVWLERSQPRPFPETPKKPIPTSSDPNSGTYLNLMAHQAQAMEDPFTNVKRKAPLYDVADNGTGNNHNDLSFDADGSPRRSQTVQGDPVTPPEQAPERAAKAARTSTVKTPGQQAAEKLRNFTMSSPLANSGGSKPTAEVPPSQYEVSPTSARLGHRATPSLSLEDSESADLAATILALVHADASAVRQSTKILVRHEISMALDVGRAKVRRCEDTIRELRERVYELENRPIDLT